jgi:4-methylaminobutanoate oxidase (formaldehyde-forming)
MLGEKVVSLATSAAWCPTVARTVILGWLDEKHAGEREFSVEAFGETHAVSRAEQPLHDPENLRLKS